MRVILALFASSSANFLLSVTFGSKPSLQNKLLKCKSFELIIMGLGFTKTQKIVTLRYATTNRLSVHHGTEIFKNIELRNVGSYYSFLTLQQITMLFCGGLFTFYGAFRLQVT